MKSISWKTQQLPKSDIIKSWLLAVGLSFTFSIWSRLNPVCPNPSKYSISQNSTFQYTNGITYVDEAFHEHTITEMGSYKIDVCNHISFHLTALRRKCLIHSLGMFCKIFVTNMFRDTHSWPYKTPLSC